MPELVDLLLAGVPGADAGAIGANLVHPRKWHQGVAIDQRRAFAEKLRKRGFTGPLLHRFLQKYPQWDARRLESLYDVTSDEAYLWLTNAGYRQSENGLWRISTHPALVAR